jgi:hypothetical protein
MNGFSEAGSKPCNPGIMRTPRGLDIELTAFNTCTGCPYLGYCTGNYPGLAYTMKGEVHHPSPDACLRAFLAQGGRIPGVEMNGNGHG